MRGCTCGWSDSLEDLRDRRVHVPTAHATEAAHTGARTALIVCAGIGCICELGAESKRSADAQVESDCGGAVAHVDGNGRVTIRGGGVEASVGGLNVASSGTGGGISCKCGTVVEEAVAIQVGSGDDIKRLA